MFSEGKLSDEALLRLDLIKKVSRLSRPQFEQLVFALNVPPENMPEASAGPGKRTADLFGWVESPVGPGLAELQGVLGEAESSTDSPASASFTEDLGNGATLEMIPVLRGGFWMGSLKDEEVKMERETPRHLVSLPAFFMGKYVVTQQQWHAVSLLDGVDCALRRSPSRFKGGNRPVECVSWNDAVEFCARLSKYSGKAYRLPSEAEWEYACRAGTMTPYSFGETITKALANYSNHYKGTTEVGKFETNAFGFYDMHGNVCEWCLDRWHENYEGAPTDGSAWIEGGDSGYGMLRGGSWFHVLDYCRSAFRYWGARDYRDDYVGFRVVCAS
ncbi:MAG: formylglycine-generating enzyme family protein [Leptolyngbyaceae cyanobacterium MO_188.B28]|nr:formylglycine-generating enzyme family protein [Leptolyngbyaceae cyanobacterium MO_188.B28]